MTKQEPIKVYTKNYRPFIMGGNVNGFMSTYIDDYEKIDIGDEYEAIVFRNTEHKDMWHVAEVTSGAIVWTDSTKTKAVDQVISDMKSADPEIIKEQIEQGKKDNEKAASFTRHDFFGKFK